MLAVDGSSHYQRAVALTAAEDSTVADRIKEWHSTAARLGEAISRRPGEPEIPTGRHVSNNLSAESQLRLEKLAELLRNLDVSGPFEKRYDKHCAQFERCGGLAAPQRGVDTLHRLVTPSSILKALTQVYGCAALPSHKQWEFIADQWSAPDRPEKWARGTLCRGGTCFAFFMSEAAASPVISNDNDLIRLHDRLGLNWAAVRAWKSGGGDRPWGLLFEYSWDQVEEIKVPTIADAGWSALFFPSPEGSASGKTFDRQATSGTPTDTGYPEIVHKNRDASCVSEKPMELEARWLRH